MDEIIADLENISEILFNNGYNSWGNAIRKAIKKMKGQEQIVRCKDCKYYDYFNGCMSWHDVNSNNDNWFCADGERR